MFPFPVICLYVSSFVYVSLSLSGGAEVFANLHQCKHVDTLYVRRLVLQLHHTCESAVYFHCHLTKNTTLMIKKSLHFYLEIVTMC